MKLSLGEIADACDASEYRIGKALYRDGRVIIQTVERTQEQDWDCLEVAGRVTGTNGVSFRPCVMLSVSETEELTIEDGQCSCYRYHYGLCEHCAALCMAYADHLNSEGLGSRPRNTPNTSGSLLSVMERYYVAERNLAENQKPGMLHVMPVMQKEPSYYSFDRKNRMTVELRSGPESRLYVVKNLPEFIHSVIHGKQYSYGKKLTVWHGWELFDADSQKLLELLADAVRESYPSLDTDQSFCYYGGETRQLSLSAAHAARMIQLLAEMNGQVELNGKPFSYREEDPPISVLIQPARPDGADLYLEPLESICPEPYSIFIRQNTIYRCSPAFRRDVLPFLHGVGVGKGNEVTVHLAERDFSRFCATVLPRLEKHLHVEKKNVDFEPYLPQKPIFRFYLSMDKQGAVVVRPEAVYGSMVYPLEQPQQEYRNAVMEQPVISLLSRLFPEKLSPLLRQVRDEELLYALLDSGLDELREQGEVYVDDSMRSFRWADTPPAAIGVSLHGGLIDISLDTPGYSVSEINQILGAYRLKKKYYRLKNGEFLQLSGGSLSVVAELSEGLNLQYDASGVAHTDAFRAPYISSVLDRDDTELDVRRNDEFRARIRALRDYRESSESIPAGLKARLRGYQRTGYRWLCALSDCGLGGILADDMGLGKTMQMLSYFLRLGGRLLVVCPASLIYNWDSEAKRFAPELETHLVHGTAAVRKEALKAESGLFITSYEQLRRDITLYEEQYFDCCVLDEAQYIRNAGTKAAKAVKQVHATHRFALTGTPIQNRLSDLWSIFDFLMPGYLFSYTEFRQSIEQKAVSGDETASATLGKLTAPFLLRRKKKDVLTELPDKVENIVFVDMLPEQRKLYDAQEQALRLSLQGVSEAEYLHQKIEYFSALMRLRQLCCTPELYLEGYSAGSGKVDACMELLRESAESGHKTLVFSQFTGMLDILVQRASEEQLPSLYLSGKNTSEQRRDMVKAFQNGDYSVFFISLKAGGTGLNLTQADRVIHFDPWWNFAAEEQATDRTHRIGQKNTVFVTKLVCRDSVEERIVDLQERKRGLSDMVMDSEAISTGNLDREELLALLERRE